MILNRKFELTLTIILTLFLFCLNAQDITHFRQNRSSVHGSFGATGIFYNSSGITPRKEPFSYILSGNLIVNLKGLVLPFSFTYSDRNRSFRQPFNQFGLSPKYKWITLHLGYRNINFSKYVLGGHTIFGAGVEFNPGKFRFGAVYGRLQKSTNQATNIYNPLNDTITSFTRKMLSFKIGVGDNNSFFDFIVLRAADDSSSLGPIPRENGVFPSTNFVTGINTKLVLTKTLHMEAEAAYSIYTSDQNSIFIIETPEFIQKIIPINISTKGYLAVRALFEYRNSKGLKFGLRYRRIDPGYKSMGTYFLNNDLENITFNTAFRLMKRKMNFSGSIGLERNNLKLARSATTKKIIGSLMFSYNPVQIFGITINYSNYSINQQAGRIQIADSIKLYQTNGTFMIVPHLQLMSKNKNVSHFVTFFFTQMKLNDKNPYSIYNNSFTTINNILSYNITFISIYLTGTLSINYNKVKMNRGNSTNTGGSIGLSKGFRKGKINLGFSVNITQSKNEQQVMLVTTPVLTGIARFDKHHSFKLKANIISNNNKTNNQSSLEEIGDLSYVFTF